MHIDMDTLRSYLSWQHLAEAAVVYYGSVVAYRLLLSPLARFPGPKLAAVSRWYEAYYDVVLDGQYTFKIAEMHKKYGELVIPSDARDPSFFPGGNPQEKGGREAAVDGRTD